jgi:hypothetical protein
MAIWTRIKPRPVGEISEIFVSGTFIGKSRGCPGRGRSVSRIPSDGWIFPLSLRTRFEWTKFVPRWKLSVGSHMTEDADTGRRIPEIQRTRKSEESSVGIVEVYINSQKYNQAHDMK